MSKLSTKPSISDYGKSNWEELYFLAKHWKSDLEFYKDDLRFLNNLIKKYLIWITKKENLESVADIRKKEHELTLTCNELHQKVSSHLQMASKIEKGGNDTAKKDFFSTHGELENEIAVFVKTFRESRKEVFKVTEYVMDSEELRNILDS
ncbi:hypothetical protein [uncultured Muriicola sp.]|uniref:hypothetical protein n=1 Tax=uncultured Muriicola sp. TaxID=1583102 RepID=UPI002629A350|nr:hypothetical protein [uncultured Muriicola sp.]